MSARCESLCIFHYTDNLPSHGGLETQLTRLCQALAQKGWRVGVFLRRAPEGDLANPYVRTMQASGVSLIAPSPRLDSCLWRIDIRNIVIAALAPLLLPVVLVDAQLRRRPVRRSWVGACGVIGGLMPDFGLLDVILLLRMAFHLRMERPIALHVHGWPRGIRYGMWLSLPVIYTDHVEIISVKIGRSPKVQIKTIMRPPCSYLLGPVICTGPFCSPGDTYGCPSSCSWGPVRWRQFGGSGL